MKPFKIWCETKKEKKAVLQKMEREGIRWGGTGHKPTHFLHHVSYTAPCAFYVEDNLLTRGSLKEDPRDIRNYYRNISVREYLGNQEKIIIYRDGRKVIALDKHTGEKAEARCNPSDTFDFNIGARIAFDRLISEKATVESEPKGFTGKAVFIGTKTFYDTDFTIGRIYSFSDGKVKDDGGDLRPISTHKRFGTTNEMAEYGFLPIVE